MKLASYKDGSRDGQLVVVSRDLKTAHYATGSATRMQHLLDDWGFISPQLQDISDSLNQGRLRHAFAFDPARCAAPLPRAYAWSQGPRDDSGPGAPTHPCASDYFLGACHEIALVVPGQAAQVAVGLAAVTGDVPLHAVSGQALEGVRLLTLFNDVWLTGDDTDPVHRPLGTAFSPVVVTPDELGSAWQGGRMRLYVDLKLGDGPSKPIDASIMTHHIGELIAKLCMSRHVGAGAIIGSPFGQAPAIQLKPGDRLRTSASTNTNINSVTDDNSVLSVFGTIDLSIEAKDIAGDAPSRPAAEAFADASDKTAPPEAHAT